MLLPILVMKVRPEAESLCEEDPKVALHIPLSTTFQFH